MKVQIPCRYRASEACFQETFRNPFQESMNTVHTFCWFQFHHCLLLLSHISIVTWPQFLPFIKMPVKCTVYCFVTGNSSHNTFNYISQLLELEYVFVHRVRLHRTNFVRSGNSFLWCFKFHWKVIWPQLISRLSSHTKSKLGIFCMSHKALWL